MMSFHRFTVITFSILIAACLQSCDKDDDPVATPADRSRIGYVMEDNFNYSVSKIVLNYTGQSNRLKSDTVYTFLAPDNGAWERLGIVPTSIGNDAGSWYLDIARNLILPGLHTLRDLPLADNQPLTNAAGFKVYITKYKTGNDTITRVNGAKVSLPDLRAGNGLIQSMENVPNAETKATLAGVLLNDTAYTLFTQALQHCGLLESLKTGEHTVLVVHNTVLRAAKTIQPGINLSTAADILASDQQALAALMKYHILNGRQFLDGIHRTATASGDASVVTMNGAKLIIAGNIDGYNSISFLGQQNTSAAMIFKNAGGFKDNFANLPCGNGVLHCINQVLIP